MFLGDDGDGSDDAFEDALGGFDEASPEESELGPETPSVTDYGNRFPEASDEDLAGSLSDLHPDTARTFIICAVLANAAILLVSLGAMLAYFRGMTQLGGGMILLGLFAALRTRMQYANWRERYEEREAAADAEADAATAERDAPEVADAADAAEDAEVTADADAADAAPVSGDESPER
ncbi:DUF7322 domain-containing protein [Haloparvum sedimenti]|uniref:DUF7322 domain-containing protein n=1 Tax=Haloparvum sedimenti TaxID=1678448 RepID=UPI00071E8137|nr:hypothetical protein [Haloparvum sedimenti]